jgi:predicted transcriptional regulator
MSGIRREEISSLGRLEGEILSLLWDAGEPQSSAQVFEAMYYRRRREKREIPAPSTLAVTLSRMVEKGLLTAEREARVRKGYYSPSFTRAEVVASVLDEVTRRLTGQPLGFFLTLLQAPEDQQQEPIRATNRADIGALIQALQHLEHEPQ